jgi:hypothetical protein
MSGKSGSEAIFLRYFGLAEDIPSRRGSALSLRTLDSLQAASFLACCEIGQDSFVCADRRLVGVLSMENADVMLVGSEK